jgi:hypothetical protein
MTGTVFECRTKATNREGNHIRFSWNWAFARRSKLVLTDESLICGDWTIPYQEIEDAILVSVRFLGWARTLFVRWGGKTYQFQLKSESWWRQIIHPFWDGPLPFSVRRETRRFEHRPIWEDPPTQAGVIILIVVVLVSLFLP